MDIERQLELTGYMAGERFDDLDQVRKYFTCENMTNMFGSDNQFSQSDLDNMLDFVIENVLWMADPKITALARYLQIDYDDAINLINGDYVVYDDDEADNAAREYIQDSLWAFNKSFLNDYSEAIRNIPDKDWKDISGKLCESFNDAVKAMIGDNLEDMMDDAISMDGRGHFISFYDGEENEIEVNGETYYIYRQN